MSTPSNPDRPAQAENACGRALTVAELAVVLEELDRVVGELQDSLDELALPFDVESRDVARDAIVAARRRG